MGQDSVDQATAYRIPTYSVEVPGKLIMLIARGRYVCTEYMCMYIHTALACVALQIGTYMPCDGVRQVAFAHQYAACIVPSGTCNTACRIAMLHILQHSFKGRHRLAVMLVAPYVHAGSRFIHTCMPMYSVHT